MSGKLHGARRSGSAAGTVGLPQDHGRGTPAGARDEAREDYLRARPELVALLPGIADELTPALRYQLRLTHDAMREVGLYARDSRRDAAFASIQAIVSHLRQERR